MKRRATLSVLFGVLGLIILVGVGSVHATLKFQTTQPVQFTFNPTLSLNVSGDLIVNNLTAGDNADSNEITVAVNTNVASGYYLTATAGTASTTTNLVNTSNNSYTFTSLATNASLDDMSSANDNEWGYAFKVGSNTYSNYSGLPLDNDDSGKTGAVLVNTSDPADSKVVTFKIGAKAATGQPAGEYTNIVNFYAVSYQAPEEPPVIEDLQYMQDFATLSEGDKANVIAKMTTGTQYQLQDSRDDKEYYVAKLPDGNIWMTQNLDLDISSNTTYNSTNTDIKTIWTPSQSTHVTPDTTWSSSNTTPESYDPGLICWDGTIGNGATTAGCTQADSSHYQIGNYYNWTAAVAMNDSSSYTTSGTDVDQSICPAGWRLPVYDGNKSYNNLATGLSLTSGTSGNIQDSPVYFVYGGYSIEAGSLSDVGKDGFYWSSVVSSNTKSYGMYFDYVGNLYPRSNLDSREIGDLVRCVLR